MSTIQSTQNQQNNYKHGLIGTISLGVGALGGAAWYKHGDSFLNNDGNLKDSFMKSVEESLTEVKDKDFIKDTKWLADARKEIDSLKSVDEVIDYYLKNNKLSENDKKVIMDNMKNMKLEDAKKFTKISMESDSRYKKYFTELFEKTFDKNKKEFIHDSNKISKTQFDCVKKVAKEFNTMGAVKVGAWLLAGTLGAGYLINWLCNKTKNKA